MLALMGELVRSLTFSRDVAVLVAQVAPVLLIAFVVEVRALATRRTLEDKGLTGLIWIVVVSFVTLMTACLVIVNGEDRLTGWAALSAWVWAVAPLFTLFSLVAMAAWAAIRVATVDVGAREERDEKIDGLLKEPGWRWLLGLRKKSPRAKVNPS